ncbi:hypothetical protein OPT61_g10131 [Boeremia exigua]|uniref:Uncharacterized protein n=1 Tax=Boeremia exigua TaxID=749465 RepID=A0ACC2HSL5_9PLEO|nr:hypothetical protein OPT61_g10131 [Boeremia exigua]
MSEQSSAASHPTPGFDLCTQAVVVPSHAALPPRRFANVSSATSSLSESASASAAAALDAEAAVGAGTGAGAVCGSVLGQQSSRDFVSTHNCTFHANAHVDLGLDTHVLDRD